MKVKELIEALSKLPQDADVYTEHFTGLNYELSESVYVDKQGDVVIGGELDVNLMDEEELEYV